MAAAGTVTPERRTRARRDARAALVLSLVLWLSVSLGVHVVLYLGGVRIGCVGGDGGGGEEGLAGAGGSEVIFSVEGPEAETPAPATGQVAPPAPDPEPEAEPTPRASRERRERADRETRESETPPPQGELAVPAPQVASATPAGPAPPSGTPAQGTGADQTDSGRAPGVRSLILGSAGYLPGSVASQRALLPRAMECADPVAGIWRAHKFNPVYRDWAIFVLRIRRGDGDKLEGTIWTRLWNGGPLDERPPDSCLPGDHHYSVRMRATGRVDGLQVRFGAESWHIERAYCPSPFFDYNPDHFSGLIDPDLQEFQSVNNDGGRDINSPYVFRRVGCFDDGPAAAATPGAPAPAPAAPAAPPPRQP